MDSEVSFRYAERNDVALILRFIVTIQDPRFQALPTGPRLTGESQ